MERNIKLGGIDGSVEGHRSEWNLDLRRAKRWRREKLRAQEENDRVITDLERKVQRKGEEESRLEPHLCTSLICTGRSQEK